MNGRLSALHGCALMVACATSALVAQTREGNVSNASSAAAAGNTWSPDRMPWRDSDLQAVWSGEIIRPRRPIQGGLTVGSQPIPEGGPR